MARLEYLRELWLVGKLHVVRLEMSGWCWLQLLGEVGRKAHGLGVVVLGLLEYSRRWVVDGGFRSDVFRLFRKVLAFVG